MEKYLSSECLIISSVFIICSVVYILVLRERFVQALDTIHNLNEAVTIADDVGSYVVNTKPETDKEFLSRFAQLVIVPIHASLRFTGMFSCGDRKYRYTILILKELGFPKYMNRIIEHRLATVKIGWDIVSLVNTTTGAGHPAVIQKVLKELLDGDTEYKIKTWNHSKEQV